MVEILRMLDAMEMIGRLGSVCYEVVFKKLRILGELDELNSVIDCCY